MNITALLENISARWQNDSARPERAAESHRRPRFTFASWRDSVLFEAPREETAAPIMVDRYRLFGEIAFGGMAAIHLGLIEGAAGFRRPVAIKRLRRELPKSHELTIGLEHEALLGAHIRHPNVVPVLDLIEQENELFLVMEYVLGETVARLLKQDGTLPTPIAVAIMGGVLRGLHAAHTTTSIEGEPLWVVHRDVSPQNILVGVDGLPRILDFGVAKSVPVETTRATMVKGKIGYIAPEQILGETVDARTDIFAAGVVLWEMLTGQRLFERQDPTEVILRLLTHGFPRISEYNPNISQELDDLVSRALKRLPEERFQTAEEFAEALEAMVQPASPSQVASYLERTAWASLQKQRLLLTSIQAHGEYLRTRTTLTSATEEDTIVDDDMEGPTQCVLPASARPKAWQRWRNRLLALGPRKLATYGGVGCVLFISSMLTVWGLVASDAAADEAPTASQAAEKQETKALPNSAATATSVAPVLVTGDATAQAMPHVAATDLKQIPSSEPEAREEAPSREQAENAPAAVEPRPQQRTVKARVSSPARETRAAEPRSSESRTSESRNSESRSSETRTPATRSCNPPYFVDAAGIKRLKPQCF